MSRIAIMAVRLATTDEAERASPGVVSKVISFDDIYTATGTASSGTALPAGCTGFLLKGVEGMTAVRLGATAELPAQTPNEILVLEGEAEYLPAREGETISLIEIT